MYDKLHQNDICLRHIIIHVDKRNLQIKEH